MRATLSGQSWTDYCVKPMLRENFHTYLNKELLLHFSTTFPLQHPCLK